MKLNKIAIISAVLIIYFSPAFSDELSDGMSSARISYRDGRYISLLRSAGEVVNADCSEVLRKLILIMPAISNYTLVQTNSSYYYSMNEGILDYDIKAGKTFTNADETVEMSIETSVFDVERYDSLIKGFDYLSNKGDYEKFSVVLGRTEYGYIIDSTSVYLALSIDTSKDTGEILSGLLFRMTFTKNIKNKEKRDAIYKCLLDFLSYYRNSSLAYSLK